MSHDKRRITLLTQGKGISERNWSSSNKAASRIVLLDSLAMLRSTIISPLVRSDSDVERIVLDRCCSESEFLSLLTEAPHEFTGDILMIRDGEGNFLSSSGRGGGRILYALTAEDVEFYLETVGLVARSEEMERGVLKFHPRIVATANERTSTRSPLENTVRIEDSRTRRSS